MQIQMLSNFFSFYQIPINNIGINEKKKINIDSGMVLKKMIQEQH